MKMIVKIPPNVLPTSPQLMRALESGLDAAAKGVQEDFRKTTSSWQHKPAFSVEKRTGERIVSTNDEIYGYVDEGTRPHVIRPKRGKVLAFAGGAYRAKTSPRVIGSTGGGSSGATVFSRGVQHPGTKAREFEQAIGEKWERGPFAELMQKALDSEVG